MINEFKAIAKRAKGILYGFDVYKFNLDYNIPSDSIYLRVAI